MKTISMMLFLIFSVITLNAEDLKMVNPTTKTTKVELNEIYKKSINAPEYWWFNFGGCWHLYRVENGIATPMNSTNYVGTTTICNEGSQNVC